MGTRRVAVAAATAAGLPAVAVAGAAEGHRTTGAKASGSTSPRAHAPAKPAHRADATGVQRSKAHAGAGPIYLDTFYSFAERAADLVVRMTLSEKASQTISSRSPAIPRLGVQPWGWWNEALHGVSRSQLLDNANATTLTNTTSYPIDRSLGSSWDPDLVYRVAGAIGDEAREVYLRVSDRWPAAVALLPPRCRRATPPLRASACSAPAARSCRGCAAAGWRSGSASTSPLRSR